VGHFRSLWGKATYDFTDPPFSDAESQEKPDGVLKVLAHIEGATVFFTREADGKFGASAKAWDEKQVVLPDQVLEVRMVAGRLRIARQAKRSDARDEHRSPQPIGADGEIAEFE
jgi:hypothetical protein